MLEEDGWVPQMSHFHIFLGALNFGCNVVNQVQKMFFSEIIMLIEHIQ